MLNFFKPKQAGIACSTPSRDEQKDCKVELVTGRSEGSSGWLLRDGQGRPLRRFFVIAGDHKTDVWSYFKDGVEVYREIDTHGKRTPNQFRWLNTAGCKWGVDQDGDGKIDSWKMISAEEVGRELFAALTTRDSARFQALLISDDDLRALHLPAAEAGRIRTGVRRAAAQFDKLAAKVPAKAQWGGMEGAVPHCVPADMLGTRQDLVKYPNRTVRYDHGDKHDWVQTGMLIKVGTAWKLTAGPTPGDGAGRGEEDAGKGGDPEMQKLLKQLATLDATTPAAVPAPGPNARVQSYNVKRANLIERILDRAKKEERDQWLKQLADCLGNAAQNSPADDKSSYERLSRLKDRVVREAAGSNLAAYVTFREMWSEFAPRLAKGGDNFAKVQEQWHEQLKNFVQAYPNAEDAPDALNQLAMGCEFNGKEGEARKWYAQLAKFTNSPLAPKARGAIRRLGLDGKVMELSGHTLDGGRFNLSRLRGKVVVVYYWASYSEQAPSDFAKLKLLQSNHKRKVELVCVNLDDQKKEAVKFLRRNSLKAVHLHEPGGLNSPLATQYGIMGLPNLFLVGKNQKVVSRTIQINDLDDEVRKLLK
jgi:hypothetical protein